MSNPTWLSAAEVHQLQLTFTSTAKRLEQHPIYVSDVHTGGIDRYLAGEVGPDDWRTEQNPWTDHVRRHAAAGRYYQRVRIHEDPPTPYQQIMRQASKANVLAGEHQRYLTRPQADALGITPDHGDWWIFDDTTMVLYHVASDWTQLAELITDQPTIAEALDTWHRAFKEATPETVTA